MIGAVSGVIDTVDGDANPSGGDIDADGARGGGANDVSSSGGGNKGAGPVRLQT